MALSRDALDAVGRVIARLQPVVQPFVAVSLKAQLGKLRANPKDYAAYNLLSNEIFDLVAQANDDLFLEWNAVFDRVLEESLLDEAKGS